MPDSLLRDLLWYHDVQNEELLSALDWKFRKLETERYDARTERDQLKEALNNAMAMLEGSHNTIDRLMAENSHLNTENERLRTALTAIVDSAEMEYFGAYGVEPELIDAARAALEAGK